MIHERLRVFVSLRMHELAPERAAIRSALSELHIDGWVFEEDAGARPQAIQQTYRQEVDAADLYIGLFWRGYGDYTIDEFNHATERNKDRLIYEKRGGIEGERDPRLQAFLDRIGKVESGLTIRWFDTPDQLRKGLKQDAARWQAEKVRELRSRNVNFRSSPVELDDQRALRLLLDKVKRFWVEGVLEGSIQRERLLELGKDTQPGWLTTGAQRWAYLIGASVVLGLFIGSANIAYWSTSALMPGESGLRSGEIIVWLTAMPVWFLAIGWVEGLGSASGSPVLERAPAGLPRAALKALVMSVALALIVAVVAMLYPPGDRLLLDLVWAGVPIVLLLAAKGTTRSISFSIEMVESLGWSPAIAWRGALLGLLGGLAVGAFAFLPTFEINHSKKLIVVLGFGTVGVALGALLGGLEPRVFKGKTVTNQGIRVSLRMAALVGLNALWLVAIVWALAKFGGFAGGARLQAILGYVAGMFTALFLWYGGIDVLKHYVLRAVLAASGQVPWNLGRLLDHRRDLNLMQKVGTGYIFAHRRLLEHLAVAQL
jgi:hypothetical protein